MPIAYRSIFPPMIAVLAGSFFIAGCQEPGYRNEVSSNAQGGVEVHRVAKDPFPDSTEGGSTSSRPESADQQRIAALEAQVRELNARLARLEKQSPTTAP